MKSSRGSAKIISEPLFEEPRQLAQAGCGDLVDVHRDLVAKHAQHLMADGDSAYPLLASVGEGFLVTSDRASKPPVELPANVRLVAWSP